MLLVCSLPLKSSETCGLEAGMKKEKKHCIPQRKPCISPPRSSSMIVLVKTPYEHLPLLLQLIFSFIPSLDPWAPLWHRNGPIAYSCSCLFAKTGLNLHHFLSVNDVFFLVEHNYKCSSFALSSIFHHLFLPPTPHPWLYSGDHSSFCLKCFSFSVF